MRPPTLPFAKVTAGLAACATITLGLTGCGFDEGTLDVISPGQGVNTDAGQVAIRNIVLVATAEHTARITGVLSSPVADRLVAVSGHPHTSQGTAGAAFTVAGPPLALSANTLLDLTDGRTGVMVSSPDLVSGYSADVTFTFASGASGTVIAPVFDTQVKDYSSVTPVPPTTPTPTAAQATPARQSAPTATPTN
jgi:hypothetical protein